MSKPEHEVGYKKPPVRSQFKKGQSGNPTGRPKGTRNFKTDLKDALAQPVQVTDGGRTRSISTQRAGLERLRLKALTGDQRALDRLIALAERHGEEETAAVAEAKLSEVEISILADYEARLREMVRQEILCESATGTQPAAKPDPSALETACSESEGSAP